METEEATPKHTHCNECNRMYWIRIRKGFDWRCSRYDRLLRSSDLHYEFIEIPIWCKSGEDGYDDIEESP